MRGKFCFRFLALFFIAMSIASCELSKNEKQESIFLNDINGDGKDDIFYEYQENGYHELIDKNFDGRIDEAHFYDQSDNIVHSQFDQDFDYVLETKMYYSLLSPVLTVVDIGSDGLYDIYFKYEQGSLFKSEKYLGQIFEDKPHFIERSLYEYDHAIKVEKISVEYLHSEFHEKVVSMIEDTK